MSSCAPRAAFLLGLLLGCAPGGPADLAAQATDDATRKPLFDDAFVQSIYREAVTALRDGAQIELRDPVPAILLTAKEAAARRKAFSKDLPENAGVTAALDLAADFVFSDSMLGRYLPDEKVLYLIEDVVESNAGGNLDKARELLFGVMAHELVHAHDDQSYAGMPTPAVLLEVAADGRKLAEIQALMTLLEGHAVYAAELASRQAGRKPLEAITLEEARRARVMPGSDDPLKQLGSSFVNTIARTKLVQYAYGREFCKDAYRFGGERFVGEVFRHLPLSMQEIESFELFKQRWARDMEAAEDADAELPAEQAAEQAAASGP